MLRTLDLPAPHEVRERPELAALTVLGFAIEAATQALEIAHPGGSWSCHLHDDPEHARTKDCLWAHQIIIAGCELQDLVDRYRGWPGVDSDIATPGEIPPDAPF